MSKFICPIINPFRFLRIKVYPFAFFLLFSLMLLSVFPACIKSGEFQTWAVIVGSGENENQTFEKSYADNDAKAIYQELVQVIGKDNVKLLLGVNATKSNEVLSIGV